MRQLTFNKINLHNNKLKLFVNLICNNLFSSTYEPKLHMDTRIFCIKQYPYHAAPLYLESNTSVEQHMQKLKLNTFSTL